LELVKRKADRSLFILGREIHNMKPIKFNLRYGDQQLKTVAELKEYGNIDMLLETLNNGFLERWLQAQGEIDLLKKIKAIDKSDSRRACDALCQAIFGKDSTIAQQATAELFDLRAKEEKRREMLKELKDKEDTLIKQYHKGYDDMIDALEYYSTDYAALKATMNILYERYRNLLKLDKVHFYEIFKKSYPLVLLTLTANVFLRKFIGYDNQILYKDIIPQLTIETAVKALERNIQNKEKHSLQRVQIETKEQLESFKAQNSGKLFICIHKDISNRDITGIRMANAFSMGDYYVALDAIIPSHIKIFSGKTDQYWKDIEPKGTQCMIISIKKGNKLRNAGKNGEELTDADINGQFIFTDGIDYMSNSDTDTLIYMEV